MLDGEGGRDLLDRAMLELQASARRHAEQLAEARTVAEDVVGAIGEGLGGTSAGCGAASRPRGVAESGRVIRVAFDRSRAEPADGADEACLTKQLGNDT